MKRGHADSSGARYLARFTMLDGTYRYIMPDPPARHGATQRDPTQGHRG